MILLIVNFINFINVSKTYFCLKSDYITCCISLSLEVVTKSDQYNVWLKCFGHRFYNYADIKMDDFAFR